MLKFDGISGNRNKELEDPGGCGLIAPFLFPDGA